MIKQGGSGRRSTGSDRIQPSETGVLASPVAAAAAALSISPSLVNAGVGARVTSLADPARHHPRRHRRRRPPLVLRRKIRLRRREVAAARERVAGPVPFVVSRTVSEVSPSVVDVAFERDTRSLQRRHIVAAERSGR